MCQLFCINCSFTEHKFPPKANGSGGFGGNIDWNDMLADFDGMERRNLKDVLKPCFVKVTLLSIYLNWFPFLQLENHGVRATLGGI